MLEGLIGFFDDFFERYGHCIESYIRYVVDLCKRLRQYNKSFIICQMHQKCIAAIRD